MSGKNSYRSGRRPGTRLLLSLLAAVSLPAAAAPQYTVNLEAPPPLRALLSEHLDLFRYRERDDIDADQLNFMIATAADQVQELAATEGYFTPKTEVKVERGADGTAVRLVVSAGPQTTVSNVDVKVAGAATAESPRQARQVVNRWPLEKGETFTQEEWAAAKQSGLQVLQQRRYPAARIAASEARINAAQAQAELAVSYDSGPLYKLGEVQVSGTRRYPESIIRNVNPLQEGEEYSVERLLEFQRQVMRTPYFSNAVIDIDYNPATAAQAPVKVSVNEFPTQRVRAGTGYTTDTGLHLDGLYSHNNVFDRAWVLTAQTRLEQRRQLSQLDLAMPPEAGGWVHSAGGSVERTTLEGIDLRTQRLGLRRTRSTDKNDLTYSLEYYRDSLSQTNGAELPDDVLVEPGTHRALVAGVSATRRRVDNALNPRRGNIITLQAGVAVQGVASDETFFRAYGRLRQFVPIGRRDLVILRAELGAVITSGGNTSVPASLLFRAGGTDSVRGYSYQSIGNKSGNRVYPTRYLATGGAEYVHWLKEDWGGAVFYDVGLATDRWEDRSLFHAVGVGARWRSPVGRVNADLAYGFQENRLRPHLSLGVAF